MPAPVIAVVVVLVVRAAPVIIRVAARAAPRIKRVPKSAPKKFPNTKPGCTQGCPNGNDICKVLAASIWTKATVLAKRIADMLEDKLNLFNLARDKPSPSLPKGSGSWQGHVHQAEGVQRGLQNDLKAYDAAGCKTPKIPKSIRDLAYSRLPSSPRK